MKRKDNMKSRKQPDTLDYNTSLVYDRETKNRENTVRLIIIGLTSLVIKMIDCAGKTCFF